MISNHFKTPQDKRIGRTKKIESNDFILFIIQTHSIGFAHVESHVFAVSKLIKTQTYVIVSLAIKSVLTYNM